MSASRRPTEAPCILSATARLAATVDLPTPPLPDATSTMFLTLGRRSVVPAPALLPRTWAPNSRASSETPRGVKARSTSPLIWSLRGHAGVVSSTVRDTLPSDTTRSFTMPRVTMSLWISGSCTVFKASITDSCVALDMSLLFSPSALLSPSALRRQNGVPKTAMKTSLARLGCEARARSKGTRRLGTAERYRD